ncbi:hypothetical protein [Propionicimonas sp.]|jgi:hypothetical protein|uniref:hypothetical protein n=1 Tax=Propionicimonas sp. TaxID=1955623 RepID=UPI0017A229D3|nr:hypothetical protein [Propionicimonas sp.]MBA3019683.1 hypothetical protein [Propionicimonas sp.]MBU4207972.1 hypothetical protein [Actinomycetota bacterium]MBU4411522.1 hypothetical protein [Actinomycetota bacterium]MCG2805801.1 hypothetical protein [Propionicimonas sp.]
MLFITVPEQTYLDFCERARRRGLGISEYVCAELALKHELEVPTYIQPSLDVEQPVYPVIPRKNITVRVPADHHAKYAHAAKARGISLAEYSRIALGVSVPAADHQGEGFGVSLLSA